MPGGRGSLKEISVLINAGGEKAALALKMSTETGEYVIHTSIDDIALAYGNIKDKYVALLDDIWCPAQQDRRALWDY
ncbi:MAG: hypothetical protein GY941_01825 [Planctomycetes bacterium]|nr:hypothetical protein [Planctomycetota bacterium]